MRYSAITFLIIAVLHSQALFADIKTDNFSAIKDSSKRGILLAEHAGLIYKATNTFGTSEHAAEGYIEYGFNALAENKTQLAQQRFNEAWLLDSDNANVYLGQGLLFNLLSKYCDASNALKLAYEKGLNETGFLADYAKILSSCATSEAPDNKQALIEESNNIYKTAHASALNKAYSAYIYKNQAESLYQQKNYSSAKEALEKAESLGAKVSAKLKAKILEQN